MTSNRGKPEATRLLSVRRIQDMMVRNLVPATQREYICAVKKLAAFMKRSPDTATPNDLRNFQAIGRRPTQNINPTGDSAALLLHRSQSVSLNVGSYAERNHVLSEDLATNSDVGKLHTIVSVRRSMTSEANVGRWPKADTPRATLEFQPPENGQPCDVFVANITPPTSPQPFRTRRSRRPLRVAA